MYKPKPIPTEHVELPREMQELIEKLAENVHDIWAEGRIREGWSYGEYRDDEKKTNPCIVPYSNLPEHEKEYDRNTAVQSLKAILALGYRIEK